MGNIRRRLYGIMGWLMSGEVLYCGKDNVSASNMQVTITFKRAVDTSKENVILFCSVGHNQVTIADLTSIFESGSGSYNDVSYVSPSSINLRCASAGPNIYAYTTVIVIPRV